MKRTTKASRQESAEQKGDVTNARKTKERKTNGLKAKGRRSVRITWNIASHNSCIFLLSCLENSG